MKIKFNIMSALVMFFSIESIHAQIPNNGFENWTNFVNYLSPDSWFNTNNVSSGSFYPVKMDTSHYPSAIGNYSVRIESNPSLLPGYEAVGVMMTGGLVAPHPAFPVLGHPTSLTGYFKYKPQNGDTMLIRIVLFQNGQPVSVGLYINTDSVTEWTSFNIPLSSYFTADSGHIILAAYNCRGPQYIPHGNSVLNIDNLNFDELITSGIDDVGHDKEISIYPNPAFENLSITFPFNNGASSEIKIYNGIGQLVLTRSNLELNEIVDISKIEKGVYFILITSESKVVYNKKIIFK